MALQAAAVRASTCKRSAGGSWPFKPKRCAWGFFYNDVIGVRAHSNGQLLGSVNIVACDMTIRPELTPWLAQLFVLPASRSQGIGAALVQAVIEWTRNQEFECLYLYTSGTLPGYYERLGFKAREQVNYLGKERTIMEYNLIQ